MTILGLDTSSPQDTAIGIYLDEDTHLSLSLHLKRSQESKLLATIDAALHSLGVSLADIQVIAVGLGPGSFTGLRIGIATARALAWAGDKKIVGIPSLELLAASHSAWTDPDSVLCAVTDAHMGQVFAGCYQSQKLQGELLDVSPLWLQQQLSQQKHHRLVLAGSGLLRYPEIARDLDCSRAPAALVQGSALWQRAQFYLEKGGSHRLEDIQPLYLRKSEAERQLEA